VTEQVITKERGKRMKVRPSGGNHRDTSEIARTNRVSVLRLLGKKRATTAVARRYEIRTRARKKPNKKRKGSTERGSL